MTGDRRYILAADELAAGADIICGETAAIKTGNRVMLKNIPVGTEVFNIELQPGKGGKMVRSAGSAARVMATEGQFVQLQMPSKEVRKMPAECYATIGKVSHPEYRFENYHTAGAMRRKGMEADGARFGDESLRSSAWRRRGTDRYRIEASQDSVGQTGNGSQDPQSEKVDEQTDRETARKIKFLILNFIKFLISND